MRIDSDRLQKIEAAIKQCTDKHEIDLLNRAWWQEYLRLQEAAEQLEQVAS